MNWVNDTTIIAAHDRLIIEYGGASGIRDNSGLKSAITRPMNSFNYGVADVYELAAIYAHGIAKNHPFVDANKRTAVFSALMFLEINGKVTNMPVDSTIDKIVDLASDKITKEEFAKYLKRHSK